VRQEAPWKAKSFMLHYIHAVIQLFLHRCAEYNIISLPSPLTWFHQTSTPIPSLS
jgi:hypothetical protein